MAVSNLEDIAAPRSCLCYTIDERYLLPALTSAIMVRRQVPCTVTDVVIACFGTVTNLTRTAAEACSAEGIIFLIVPVAELQGMPMICARFFLDKILDPQYLSVTYLDADTQVVRPLTALLTCPIAAGSLIASPDLMALMSDHGGAPWQRRRAYFRSVGIPNNHHSRYFNSGMIRFRLGDWAEISKDCLSLCRSPVGQTFQFPDQDALNVVLAGRATLVSLRWNFPGFFLGHGLEDIATPSIIHYMSNPRPWDGPFHPWGKEGAAPYRLLVDKYPELAGLHRPIAGKRLMKYRAQQFWKRHVYNWGSRDMRRRISFFEKNAAV